MDELLGDDVMTNGTNRRNWRRLWIPMLSMSVLLSGCASFSPDGGMSVVEGITAGELQKDVRKITSETEAAEVRARVKSMLSGTLSADQAVQIALLNNRGLQAAFNELGVSEAQMIEASLPPSPTISLARLSAGGLALEIERSVLQNVLGLLTLPRRREIAEIQFRQAQLRATNEVLKTAAETRRTYYRAVAAGQTVILLKKARLAAESLSDLATKLGETGALNRINQARQHEFYAQVSQQLAVAILRHRTERDRLARLMGLWGDDIKYRLPDELRALPGRAMRREEIESEAVASRVDLQLARLELETLAKSYGLTRATRFINVFEVGAMSNTEWERVFENGTPATEKLPWRGFEVEFQIPIYDFGKARTRGAAEAYRRAINRLADKAVNVRGEAREAYQSYRGVYDIAKLYSGKLVPLRDVISEEMLLQYNGMLADLFELLGDVRARNQTNVAAIEALRDFWLSTVDLQTAVVGGGGDAALIGEGGAQMVAADASGGH